MSEELPDPFVPYLSLAPVVETQPAQSRPSERVHVPESHNSDIEHLWADGSDLIETIKQARHLLYVACRGWADAAGLPIQTKLRMYYRVLRMMSRDPSIPDYQYDMICFLIDEIRSVLPIKG